MNVKLVFRCVLVFLVFLESALFWGVWDWTYFGNERALAWLGAGSILDYDVLHILVYLLYFMHVVSYVGLFLFLSWSKKLLMATVVVTGFSSPFFGIAVGSGVEELISYFLTLGSGLVLGVSYFSDIKFYIRDSL